MKKTVLDVNLQWGFCALRRDCEIQVKTLESHGKTVRLSMSSIEIQYSVLSKFGYDDVDDARNRFKYYRK